MTNLAISVEVLENYILSVTFQNGVIKEYDVKQLFDEIPLFQELKRTKGLFEKAKLSPGGYAVCWNDELDIAIEEVWDKGVQVDTQDVDIAHMIGYNIAYNRDKIGMTQVQLSKITGIHQAEISKLERGMANPSLSTLKRVAAGLNMELRIEFVQKK